MCLKRQCVRKKWPKQLASLFCVVCGIFLSSLTSLILFHFSHDHSKWSSSSFSSTPFKIFPGISDLLFEVSKFQHHTQLCSKCSNLLYIYIYIYKSNLLAKRIFFLLNVAFAVEVLDLISRIHVASFVITTPPKKNPNIWNIPHSPVVWDISYSLLRMTALRFYVTLIFSHSYPLHSIFNICLP